MTTRQDYGRALLKARFYAFLQYAFAQLHPTQTLSEQPYLEAFCYQLERCARGENRRLVVNMPPRHLKSFSLIALQAWMLGREPDLEEACIFGLRTVEAALIHRSLRSEITQERVGTPFVLSSLTEMLAGYLGIRRP